MLVVAAARQRGENIREAEMASSFYDATVGTYLQVNGSLQNVLAKGRKHYEETGASLAELVGARVHPTMLPFSYQVESVVNHSLGALDAMRTGVFAPSGPKEHDYAGLEALIADAGARLAKLDRAEIEGLIGRDVSFKVGEHTIPFVAEDFAMTFSLPNLYFHATTAYAILRGKGVPLGKGDFLGRMRIKR
jgi:hypothetical protein